MTGTTTATTMTASRTIQSKMETHIDMPQHFRFRDSFSELGGDTVLAVLRLEFV